MRLSRVCLLITAIVFLTACPATRRATLQMDPLVIEVQGDGEPFRVFTPTDLLRRANEDEDCLTALPRYEEIISEFPGTPEARMARYNQGLCHELGEQWKQASAAYRRVAQETDKNGPLWTDAHLRRAFCLEKLGRPREASRIYKKVARTRKLPAEIRTGAALRRGIAELASGSRRRGERIITRALARADKLKPPVEMSVRASAAEAAYARGQLAARDFEDMGLHLPSERLAGELKQKADALAVAREHFIRVMHYRDAGWAASAGVRVGELYEHLHDQLLALPEPDLPDGALVVYRRETTRRLVPLRQQAFQAYLQVLLLAERVGLDTKAIGTARNRVSVLEPLLKSQVLSNDGGVEEPKPEPEPE